MTVDQMRNLIGLHLAEARVDNDRLTPAMMLDYLNIAYTAVAVETECFIESVSIARSTGTNGVFAMVKGMFGIRSVIPTPLTKPLNLTTIGALNYAREEWRTTAEGTPLDVAMFDQRKFVVSPPPSAEYDPLVVEGVYAPSAAAGAPIPLLVNASDEPLFLPSYHEALVYDAVAKICGMYMLTNELAAAKRDFALEQRAKIVNEMKGYQTTALGLAKAG